MSRYRFLRGTGSLLFYLKSLKHSICIFLYIFNTICCLIWEQLAVYIVPFLCKIEPVPPLKKEQALSIYKVATLYLLYRRQ